MYGVWCCSTRWDSGMSKADRIATITSPSWTKPFPSTIYTISTRTDGTVSPSSTSLTTTNLSCTTVGIVLKTEIAREILKKFLLKLEKKSKKRKLIGIVFAIKILWIFKKNCVEKCWKCCWKMLKILLEHFSFPHRRLFLHQRQQCDDDRAQGPEHDTGSTAGLFTERREENQSPLRVHIDHCIFCS